MKFVRPVTVRLRESIARAKALWPENHRILAQPRLVGYAICTAHRTLVVSSILILLMIFVAPLVSDYLARTLFPPETAKKVFGLIKTQNESPLKSVFETTMLAVLWVISLLYIFYRFWLELPAGAARAEKGAEKSTQVVGDKTMIEMPSSKFVSGKKSSETRIEDRYRLAGELGRGAMGVVYKAVDTVLDRKVALKQLSVVLSGDEEHASRFRREAKALAKLTHANVVQVYDLIEERGRLWMVLEYVEGGDLACYAKERGRLTIADAAKLIIPVAEGLAYAHSQGIVHRDLKPANILLSTDQLPKISDFGIAKLSQGGNLTQMGTIMGSPPYMSPEQCCGDPIDNRTDIYSLGITLYELLSGSVPFKGDTAAILSKHITEPPKPLSEITNTIPPEAEGLILSMLAKKADDRPADMREVISSLSIFLSEQFRSENSQPVSV